MKRILIGGAWVDAAGGTPREIRNPATLQPIDTVADCGAADVERAVAAARDAQPEWWRVPGVEKTRLLQIGAEAVKTLASAFKAANTTRTLHKRPFGSLESKKMFVDLAKGTLKKGLEEILIGEDPTVVFTSSNDRVVPVPKCE